MKKTRDVWILFTFISLFLAPAAPADTYIRQPAIDVVHYEIALELSDLNDAISGTTRVHAMMQQDGVSGMWLDFAGLKVDKLQVRGMEESFSHINGRLSFAFGSAPSANEEMR